jgi:hypothetical protein
MHARAQQSVDRAMIHEEPPEDSRSALVCDPPCAADPNQKTLVRSSLLPLCALRSGIRKFCEGIRPSLIWFWSAFIRSPALFSPPLSALAAIILAVDKRDVIIGALTRPFQ